MLAQTDLTISMVECDGNGEGAARNVAFAGSLYFDGGLKAGLNL